MNIRQHRRRVIAAMRNHVSLVRVGPVHVHYIHENAAGDRSGVVTVRLDGLPPDRDLAVGVKHTITTDPGYGRLTTWVTEASKLPRK